MWVLWYKWEEYVYLSMYSIFGGLIILSPLGIFRGNELNIGEKILQIGHTK